MTPSSRPERRDAWRASPRRRLFVNRWNGLGYTRTSAASDVDVALLAPEATVGERLDIAVALMRSVRRPVDVVFLDIAPPLLRFEVARDGRVISIGPRAAGSPSGRGR